MLNFSFAFDSPWYLLLLGLAPVLWALSFRTLAGLGPTRRIVALTLRSLVLAALVLALADMQYRKSTDRVTVIYVLDQSLSIPEDQRDVMRRFVNETVRRHLRDGEDDNWAVIDFGRDAEVEVPPVDFAYELGRIETQPDRDYTNLEAALEKAMSLFPHDTAKRVVVVTDGNENVGNALRQARQLAAAGISIDVLPVPLAPRSEVAVDKVVLPADVRRGQPFELRAVVDHQPPPEAPDRVVSGRLRIERESPEGVSTLWEDAVELAPGKNVFTTVETVDQPAFYTYRAQFFPGGDSDDAAVVASVDGSNQNNTATAFTHVEGRGHVLLIEDWENPGEFTALVDRLREERLEVTVQPSNQLFSSLAELQRYDTVVLANVPRTSGFTAGADGGVDSEAISGFSENQIQMLATNTEELGCGMIMIGGQRSFGAGDWIDTEIEKAMPVDFRIKSARVTPVGALAMIMHASEFARGNYWQKVIAREAIGALGPRDYCGLLQWTGTDQWLWNHPRGMLTVGPNRQRMMARVDRLVVGDMPAFDPGMRKAAAALAQLTNPVPAIKHCIIISDGDPSPPTPGTIKAFVDQKVKITTVAVGALGGHGDLTMMQDIARQTGGKFYVVRNANALPKIYQREARRVARPLIKELEPPARPSIMRPEHEIVQGLDGPLPPISGFVMTTLKSSSLVEQVIRSPQPANAEHSTVLATWTYGLGKTAAFTTDAGARWANAWTGWEDYEQFFSQLVRWSMRPTGDTGNYFVTTETSGGTTRVIVDALTEDDQFINAQTMTGTAITPLVDGQSQSLPVVLEQVAPGRYVGEFESQEAGAYMLSINPGPGAPQIRTGVNVSYSDEFRARETNRPLLEQMARLEPRGGEPGKVIDEEAEVALPPAGEVPDAIAEVDPFRRDLPPAVASQDVWPLLVLVGSCLFFADVFVRRVQFGFEWAQPAVEWVRAKILRREVRTKQQETMSRLQSRKRELRQASERAAAETRFEFDETAAPAETPLATTETRDKKGEERPRDSEGVGEPTQEEESYLQRLKRAKDEAKRKQSE